MRLISTLDSTNTSHAASHAPGVCFGAWVREQREGMGLSKTECARLTRHHHSGGVTVQRWAAIEYAVPRNRSGSHPQVSRKTAEMVAFALGIPSSAALHAAGYIMDSRNNLSDLEGYLMGMSPEDVADLTVQAMNKHRRSLGLPVSTL